MSCGLHNLPRPNAFAIITANRVYNCTADDTKDMHKWISALSPRRWIASVGTDSEDTLEKGEWGWWVGLVVMVGGAGGWGWWVGLVVMVGGAGGW